MFDRASVFLQTKFNFSSELFSVSFPMERECNFAIMLLQTPMFNTITLSCVLRNKNSGDLNMEDLAG
jgi:hypothetical protein